MNGFLLDTNVISIFSPPKSAAVSQAFIDWQERQAQANSIYLSAITIHELEKGAQLLVLKAAMRQAALVRAWLDGLVAGYSDNILPLDGFVAKVSGALEALAISAGHSPGAADAMIAGTAKAHELTIVTRNVKHFLPFGVALMSPDQLAP